MTRSRWTALGLLTTLLLVIGLSAFDKSLDAQEKKGPRDQQAAQADGKKPWAGKVLLVQKKNDQSPSLIHSEHILVGVSGFVLENAAFVEIGGVRFLTGHGIEQVDGKPTGPRVNLPLDSVGAILEFEDVEAFKQFEDQQNEKMRQSLEMQHVVPFDPNGADPVPDA